MPVFQYKGLTAEGKTVNGLREADNPKLLRALLKGEGVFLTEVLEGKAAGAAQRSFSFTRAFARVGGEDVSVMTRQLATLIAAQIPLVEALTALVDQMDNEQLKVIVSNIKTRVNEGSSLADALAEHPRVFSNLYVNMVRAGESAGALEVVLGRLADYTESQAHLNQKIKAAMVYPLIMLVVGSGIMIGLFTFVIPKLTRIFEDINATLPIYTQLLIFVSHLLSEWWYAMLGLLGGAVYGFVKWKTTATGRRRWDSVVLRSPIFGKLVRMLAISRFARTLSTLLNSGVPLLVGLDIVKNIVNNSVLIDVIEQTRDAVREGESIAAPLRRSGEFPPIVTHMIGVGEKTGRVEEMLDRVAESYNAQIEVRINALTTLLEPIMILVMGGSVAFVVMSILLPILKINEFAQ